MNLSYRFTLANSSSVKHLTTHEGNFSPRNGRSGRLKGKTTKSLPHRHVYTWQHYPGAIDFERFPSHSPYSPLSSSPYFLPSLLHVLHPQRTFALRALELKGALENVYKH